MFEKSTWIRLPRNLVIGHGVLDRTVSVVDDLDLRGTPLVVTSPTPRDLAAEPIAAAFEAAGRTATIVEPVESGPASVEHVTEVAREADAGFLLGVGGGTVVDVTKMASERLERPFVSVPTVASHDGIVSGRSSIPDGDTRHSVAAAPPLAVIADTRIIAEAPWELTTAGCADIISNYTAVKDWRLANRLQDVEYSEYAAALSKMTAEMLVDNADSIRPGIEESAWIVVKALVSSGVAMSIAGSSRPASGAEHLFSHQLDRLVPDGAPHGHQVGVGAILTEYLHSGEDGQWTAIRDALGALDAPTTAAALGVEPATIIEALTTAHEIRDRFTILGAGISEAAARRAATETGVI